MLGLCLKQVDPFCIKTLFLQTTAGTNTQFSSGLNKHRGDLELLGTTSVSSNSMTIPYHACVRCAFSIYAEI